MTEHASTLLPCINKVEPVGFSCVVVGDQGSACLFKHMFIYKKNRRIICEIHYHINGGERVVTLYVLRVVASDLYNDTRRLVQVVVWCGQPMAPLHKCIWASGFVRKFSIIRDSIIIPCSGHWQYCIAWNGHFMGFSFCIHSPTYVFLSTTFLL